MSCSDTTLTSIPLQCVNQFFDKKSCPTSMKFPLNSPMRIPITGTPYKIDISNDRLNMSQIPNLIWGKLQTAMAEVLRSNPELCPIGNDMNGSNISDILSNIQKLQATETDLINQLDTYTSTAGFVSTDAKVIALVNNINRIADARISMFKTISTNAIILQTGVSQARTDLVSQLTLLQVVEDQLNQAKSRIDQLSEQNDTKMRMVEINTYYGHRYEAQSNLMKKIILFCFPVLILFILKKKGILPELIATYLIGIVIAIGAFLIIRNIWDIFTRSNMDFDTYDWYFEFADTISPPTIWEYNKEHFFKYFDLTSLIQNLMSNLGICVADTCCGDKMTYDSNLMKCVVPPGVAINSVRTESAARSTNKLGFTTNQGLQAAQYRAYFDDDKNNYKGIAPFSYDMAYANV